MHHILSTMKISLRNVLFIFLSIGLLYSCASKKDLVYLQGIENQKSYEASLKYEIKLQPDDLLSIVVSAENPEVTTPFNLPQVQGNVGSTSAGGRSFLIDNDGFIEYPVLGKIKLAGLTRTEATTKLTEMIGNYINEPSIAMKVLNFKITILGEVGKPGTFTVTGERITILEALSLAGDLGIYGKRKNVLIIHDDEGKKTYTRIDVTNANLLNSPQYYLSQNDVIVVEANRTKLNSSVVGPNIAIWLTSVSLVLTLLIFFRSY